MTEAKFGLPQQDGAVRLFVNLPDYSEMMKYFARVSNQIAI